MTSVREGHEDVEVRANVAELRRAIDELTSQAKSAGVVTQITNPPRDRALAALTSLAAVVDRQQEALTQIADFGHEMDDYELPPKEARKIARKALAVGLSASVPTEEQTGVTPSGPTDAERVELIAKRRSEALDGFSRWSSEPEDAGLDHLIVYDVPWLIDRLDSLAAVVERQQEALREAEGGLRAFALKCPGNESLPMDQPFAPNVTRAAMFAAFNAHARVLAALRDVGLSASVPEEKQ